MNVRKIIILCLCALLIVALAAHVYAANDMSIAQSKTTAYRGDTVSVTVSVSGWDACSVGSIEVTCGNGLELTKGEWLVESPDISYFDINTKDGGFGYGSAKTVNGGLIRLTFKVKSNASFAAANIGIKLTMGGKSVEKSTSVTVACKHDYGKWKDKSSTQHTHTCGTCGNVETANHTYDNPCDNNCNGCGAVRNISHKYTKTWISDKTGHWHSCEYCKDKKDFAKHISSGSATEFNAETCTVCSFEIAPALPHEHKYSNKFETYEDGHKTVCDGCGQAGELTNHDYENDCDELCETCNYQREVNHKLSIWDTDESNHWHTCGDCNNVVDSGQHDWGTGEIIQDADVGMSGQRAYTCSVCGKMRVEVIPALRSVSTSLSWWMWALMGFGVGILVSATIVVVFVLCIARKSTRGKYSSSVQST